MLILLASLPPGLVLQQPLTTPTSSRCGRASLSMALPWRSGLGKADADWKVAFDSAVTNLSWTAEPQPSLALLFVPQDHASKLEQCCAAAVKALSPQTLVAVVGAGVAGASSELMGEPCFSIVAGELPEETAVRPFIMTGDSMPSWPSLGAAMPDGCRPSFLVFADPFSPVTQAISCLDDAYPASVVAGGLSCPTSEGAQSLAFYVRGAMPRVLPAGAVLGLALGGPRLEVHTACAQGAVTVGPTFTVTAGRDNLVEQLDGQPALEALQGVAQGVKGDTRLLKLLQQALLVGVRAEEEGGAGGDDGDFLIRQVTGATPQGGIYVGDRIEVGAKLRFFVRDGVAADADLKLMLDRYRVARTFSGRFSGGGGGFGALSGDAAAADAAADDNVPAPPPAPVEPLATLLFACNGRGTNMYGADDPDHDTRQFEASVAATPLAGFFCNGEIGPAGVRLPAARGEEDAAPFKTHLHGFTSVFAMLYETAPPVEAE